MLRSVYDHENQSKKKKLSVPYYESLIKFKTFYRVECTYLQFLEYFNLFASTCCCHVTSSVTSSCVTRIDTRKYLNYKETKRKNIDFLLFQVNLHSASKLTGIIAL